MDDFLDESTDGGTENLSIHYEHTPRNYVDDFLEDTDEYSKGKKIKKRI